MLTNELPGFAWISTDRFARLRCASPAPKTAASRERVRVIETDVRFDSVDPLRNTSLARARAMQRLRRESSELRVRFCGAPECTQRLDPRCDSLLGELPISEPTLVLV